MKKMVVSIYVLMLLVALGATNNGLEFDGNNDYVNLFNNVKSSIGNSFTVSTWVKIDRTYTAASGDDCRVIHYNGMFSLALGSLPAGQANGVFIWLYGDDSAMPAKTKSVIQLNVGEWTHIAATWDGTTSSLYVNGQLEDFDLRSLYTLPAPNNDLYLGIDEDLTTRKLDGSLDEVRIWNVARSQTQIQNNMFTELAGNESGVVAYYKLNEGSGQAVADGTVNNYDGILGSTTGVDDNDPIWILSDVSLPVTLSNFSAQYVQNQFVKVNWTSESETNMYGYKLYRSQSDLNNIEFTSALIEANNTPEAQVYSFEDYEVAVNETYNYWIEALDMDGSSIMHGPVALTIPNDKPDENSPDIPDNFGLYSNYPNPFNPTTNISFALANEGACELTIYDAKGRKIKTLFSGNIEAERRYSFIWNGDDAKGQAVASGIYFYKIISGKYIAEKKMILMK